MNPFSTGALAALLLVAGAPFAAGEALDKRAPLELTPEARHFVLTEMRGFVIGLQRITAALSEEDMRTVALSARELGTAAAGATPPEIMRQLPEEFRKLGFSVHREFDQIALDAEAMEDRDHTLRQVSQVLNGCVACHATYQIRTVGE